MHKFENEADLNNLIGQLENNVLEAKTTLISYQDMLREIHSFINGEEKTCNLIFGVSEDADNKIQSIDGIEFPISVRGDEDHQKRTTLNGFLKSAPVIDCVRYIPRYDEMLSELRQLTNKIVYNTFHNLEDFKNIIFRYLASNTEIAVEGIRGDKDKIDEHLKKLIKFREIKLVNNKIAVVVEITQSPYRPVYDKKNNKYYIRKTTNDKAESPPMSHHELERAVKARELRLAPEGIRPVYHHLAIPALPVLTSLFDLIYVGNNGGVEKLLQDCPTLVQMSDSFGRNALHIAVFYEQSAIVESLIQNHGMSIFQSDKDGWTPLFQAVSIGNLALTEILINLEPSCINQRDKWGNNVVLIAARYNQAELLDYFLNTLQLPKDLRNNESRTPLLEAAFGGCLQAFEFLISTYPDKKQAIQAEVDKDNLDAIKIAENFNNESHVKLLRYIKSEGMTPLMHAARDGDFNKFQELLEEYPNKRLEIDKVDWNNSNTLQIAELYNQDGSHNNLITYIKNDGRTPLLLAAEEGNLVNFQEALETYPDRQAAIEFEYDWDGMSANEIANYHKHQELVEFIEDELKNEESFPPLLQPIIKGNLNKLIELLSMIPNRLDALKAITWKGKNYLEVAHHCLKIYKTTNDASYISRYTQILRYLEKTLPAEEHAIITNLPRLHKSTARFFRDPLRKRNWKTPSAPFVELNGKKYFATINQFFPMSSPSEMIKSKSFCDYLNTEGFTVDLQEGVPSEQDASIKCNIVCVNLGSYNK